MSLNVPSYAATFESEGAQRLPLIDLQRFLRLAHQDPSVLERLHPEDQARFRRAALASEAIRKMPPGVRSGREAVWLMKERGEPIPPLMASFKPLDPSIAATRENALRNWSPVHLENFQAILGNFKSGERPRSETTPEVEETLVDKTPRGLDEQLHRDAVHDSAPGTHDERVELDKPAREPVPSARDVDASLTQETPTAPPPRESQQEDGAKAPASQPVPLDTSYEAPRPPPLHEPSVAAFHDAEREKRGAASGSPRNPTTLLDQLQSSRRRIAAIAQTSLKELQHGSAVYRSEGEIALPPPRPRKGFLEASTHRLHRSDVPLAYRKPISAMDAHVRSILQQVTSNPVWIAAEYVERSTRIKDLSDFPPSRDELRESPELAVAARSLDEARRLHAGDVISQKRAQQQLAAYQRRPGWLKAAQNLVLDTERELKQKALTASVRVLESSNEMRTAEAEAKSLYASRLEEANEIALEQRQLARSERLLLERPLREAVLERHRAQEALCERLAPERVLDAPERTALTYQATIKIDGFSFASLRGEDGRTYLLDRTEHTLNGAKLRTGDVVQVSRDENQSRHVSLVTTAKTSAQNRDRETSRGR